MASKYPVPDASPRSVAGSDRRPPSCQVSQSCGSSTAAVRAAFSGSARASQRSLVTVNDAGGTEPTWSAQACGPPSSATRSIASGPERLSFHSSASRTSAPSSSKVTMPCCWPPTAIASTPSSRPGSRVASAYASAQAWALTSVPGGWAARPVRSTFPVSASQTTTEQDWVDESTPATRLMPAPYASGHAGKVWSCSCSGRHGRSRGHQPARRADRPRTAARTGVAGWAARTRATKATKASATTAAYGTRTACQSSSAWPTIAATHREVHRVAHVAVEPADDQALGRRDRRGRAQALDHEADERVHQRAGPGHDQQPADHAERRPARPGADPAANRSATTERARPPSPGPGRRTPRCPSRPRSCAWRHPPASGVPTRRLGAVIGGRVPLAGRAE